LQENKAELIFKSLGQIFTDIAALSLSGDHSRLRVLSIKKAAIN